MEGRKKSSYSTRSNSSEEEDEQQPLLQENKDKGDNKHVSTSDDGSGLYDEAVGGPSTSQPSGQTRRLSAVVNAFIANWKMSEVEGKEKKHPDSTRSNSSEGEDEQQPLLQENKDKEDNKHASTTSDDESGLHDEAVDGPSTSQPSGQTLRLFVVVNAFTANWEMSEIEGKDKERPDSTRSNSSEVEDEQQPMLQENKNKGDNKHASATSDDESGLYDEAVGGPSTSQPSGQTRRISAVVNSANLEMVIGRVAEALRQKELFNTLRQPTELITTDLNLRYGQRIMLASYMFQPFAESPTSPRENFLALAVSYREECTYEFWPNNSIVTGVIDKLPRTRSVFCIRSVFHIGNHEIVRYGQFVFFEVTVDGIPYYLEVLNNVTNGMCKLRVTETLNSACYFRIMHPLQPNEEQTDCYMPFRVAFILQHVLSGLFLTFDYGRWTPTIYGLECAVTLQPLVVFGDGTSARHFYFKTYVP